MDTSAGDHRHSCIRAKLGLQAIKHFIATQHIRDILLGEFEYKPSGWGGGGVSVEDNLSHMLYSFSPCLLLKNKKPNTVDLFAASYNYIIHDELTGVYFESGVIW